MVKIVIIGAGVTGLVAALRLSESNIDSIKEIVVIEQRSHPGGLFQSTNKNGFWWDNGAFVFNRSSYLVKLLPDMFKQLDDMTTKVWHKGKLHTFPFGISDYVMSHSALNLAATSINYICANAVLSLGTSPSNLHDWLRYRMTEKVLSETGLETYFQKLQAKAATELSPLLGYQRLRGIHNWTRPGRLIKSITKHLYRSNSQQVTPAVYPRGNGVGSELAELCRSHGVKIIYNAKIKKIEKNKAITKLFYNSNFDNGCYQASHVISTIPLNELVDALIPQATPKCLSCANSIAYMDMQLVFFYYKDPCNSEQIFNSVFI